MARTIDPAGSGGGRGLLVRNAALGSPTGESDDDRVNRGGTGALAGRALLGANAGEAYAILGIGGLSAPVAADDRFMGVQNTAWTLTARQLLRNDTSSVAASITAVGNASNGSVTLNPDGTIGFTPAAGFVGDAGFDYTISDGGLTDVGRVTIRFAMAAAAPTIDLASLAAADGFIVRGNAAGDYAGYSVAAAGDVNGDGIDDLIVGASRGDNGGQNAGEAYVIFGKAGATRADIDLTNLAAADGFIVQGDAAGDRAGRSVSAAGDVNGDGIGDLIVGAPRGDNGGSNAGEAYVIFGMLGTSRANIDLTSLGATDGFVIQGDAADDYAGFSVSAAGDVNGDGIGDLIVGAPYGNDGGSNAGEAYVIFGKAGATRTNIDLASLAAADGFIVQGDAGGDQAGFSVAAAGDVNGDGVGDLVVGANLADNGAQNAGEVYVIFGMVGATRANIDLTSLIAADGFIIEGDASNDRAGYSVSAAGDVNGDGIGDLIVGAPRGDNGGPDAGEAYVIFGKAGATRASIDLASLAAADGFVIQGDAGDDQAGFSVAAAGDLNGDGIDDLIVGAPYNNAGGANAGKAYVIFGRAGATRANIDLASLAAADGVVIQGGAAGDRAGFDVSAAGDVNHDGIDDLLVGAPRNDDGGADAGEAYVIFGRANFLPDRAPIVSAAISDQASPEDAPWSFTLPANAFVDPDGDPLAYGATLADDSTLPAWLAFDPATRTFTGTPPKDFSGPFDLKVTATANGQSVSDVFTLTVTPTPDAPILSIPVPDQASPEDAAWSFALPAGTFFDADGDALTYTASLADGSALPAWLAFNPAARTFSGTPPKDFNGAVDLKVTATAIDGTASDVFTLTITPVADAPVVKAAIADQASPEDAAWSFVVPAGTFVDAEGDALSYGASLSDGSALPAWLAFDAATRTFSGTPPQDFNGPLDLKVTATAADGAASDVFRLTVTPVADAPVLRAPVADQASPEDTPWIFTLPAGAFADPDGDTLNYSATLSDNSPLPAWLAFNAATRTFIGTPPKDFNGTIDLKVAAAAADGSASDVFALTITPRPEAPPAPVVDPGSFGGEGGFTMLGAGDDSFTGWSVSDAGDINGDGFADFIVGAPGGKLDPNLGIGAQQFDDGEVYVIFGKAGATRADFSLGQLSTADGFTIRGKTFSLAGTSVSAAGDINGDGIDDMIIGAPVGTALVSANDIGEAYVIFGLAGATRPDIDLSSLGAAEGVAIVGKRPGVSNNLLTSSDYAGASVSAAGDVNGDGFADLIVGAPFGNDLPPVDIFSDYNDLGEAYVIFGKGSATPARIDIIPDLAGIGFTIRNLSKSSGYYHVGWSVSSAGDVNGDGIDDVIVGAPYLNGSSSRSGKAYVVFGQAGATRPDINLNNLGGSDGFVIKGGGGDQAGYSVSAAGDVNGDGIGDLIVGAPLGDDGGNSAGEAYVVFGKAGATRAAIDLAALTAADGFIIQGDAAGNKAGFSVSVAGDVNGDGIDDIIVGTSTSKDYVIFGKAGAVRANIDLTGLTAADGIVIQGQSTSGGVSGAGDINGDGFDDLVVGTPFLKNGYPSVGGAYVIFGRSDFFSAGIADQASPEDAPWSFTLPANALVDPEGDPLTFAATLADGSALPAWLAFDAATQTFSGTPPRDFNGTLELKVTAAAIDGTLSDVFALTITPAPDMPVVDVPVPDQASPEDAAWSFTLPAGTFLDVDGDTLTYAATLADGSALPAWLAFDAATQTFSGTPPKDFNGTVDLKVTANAADGSASDVFTLTVTPVPDAPVVNTPIPDQASPEEAPWSFTVPAGALFDVDGDPLTYAATLADGSALPAWLAFDAATQTFSGTPPRDFNGTFDLKVTATAVDGSASDVFTLTITPVPETRVYLGSAAGNIFVAPYAPDDRWTVDGRAGADSITTSNGSDTIIAGWGNDTVNAGGGDDIIAFDPAAAPGDRSAIDGGAGFDEIRALFANATIGLAALTGVERIDGGGFANVSIALTASADMLDLSGVELVGIAAVGGGGGNDTIIGSAGNDTFIGGAGADMLTGGPGADIFAYGAVADSDAANADTITDFAPGLDRIDLGAIDADTKLAGHQPFNFIGGAAFSTMPGELRLNTSVAGVTIIEADIDGDAKGDLVIRLLGQPQLTAADFLPPLNAGGAVGLGATAAPAGTEGAVGPVAVALSAPAPAPVIDLSSLAAADGFIIQGEAASDRAGWSVAAAGDVNGDGFADLIVGAPYAGASRDYYGNRPGAAYVIFGKAGATRADIALTGLGAADGFIVLGDEGADDAGRSVAGAGDINGDGIDDLIVGAPYGDDGGVSAGEAYVIFGKAGAARTDIDLTGLSAADGFIIQGDASFDSAGRSVAAAGDINGDGIGDLIVGAPYGDDGGDYAGEAYVIFGKAGAARTNIDLTNFSAADGFVIQGDAEYDRAGFSVSAAGDVNGDGFADVIVGGHYAGVRDYYNVGAGAAYVIFGQAGAARTNIDLTNFSAADGFVIQGEAVYDRAGYSVAAAGDVNGDGIGDLIVGAPSGRAGAGAAYVIFGKAGAMRANIDLAGLAAADGFVIQGDAAGDQAGFSVAAAGDINGDDIGDLVVGANLGDNGSPNAGEAYVIIGKAGATRANIDLASLSAADGFVVQGDAAADQAGRSVSGAGDINADGFDDLIIGAPLGDDGGKDAGEAYVIFGRASFLPVPVPPVVSAPIPDQASPEEVLWSFVVPAGTFSDSNGDPLTYAATLADDSALPAWLTFDAATLTFGGTPPRDFNGTLDLKVTATAIDGSASDVFTLTITPVPDTRIYLGTTTGDIFVAPYAPGDRWTVDGRAGADSITTSDGSDTIIAGWGNDTVNAGGGDDIIAFDPAAAPGDRSAIDGGAGFDEIRALFANATIGLAALTGVERIDGGGFANVSIALTASADMLDLSGVELVGIAAIKGGGGNDTIIGSAGNDTILGEAGNDALFGGMGDDLFLVSGIVRLDSFDGGGGVDTIRATAANTRIRATSFSGIEAIDGSGFAGVGLDGTAAADTIDLSGIALTGIAVIEGGAGDDRIIGSASSDTIKGGAGADSLTGGPGADIFDYDAVTDSNAINPDKITDFVAGLDRIDLSTIDAITKVSGNQAFSFIGGATFSTTPGELRLDTTVAGLTTVQADTNGDGKADLFIHLQGQPTLTVTDFLL